VPRTLSSTGPGSGGDPPVLVTRHTLATAGAPFAGPRRGLGLATIVHRRPAATIAPAPAKGPGGSLRSLTRMGWLFAIAGIAWFLWNVRSLVGLGEPQQLSLATVAQTVLDALRGACLVALVVGLELGVPGARRVTPWLWRGAVLLGAEQLGRAAMGPIRQLAVDNNLTTGQVSLDEPVSIAIVLLTFALAIVGIAGAWAFSDGLADAGGRAPRPVLLLAAVVGVVITAWTYGLFSGSISFDFGTILAWLNVVAFLLSFLDIALWMVIAVRLVAGAVRRRPPKEAWLYGALAGVLLLAIRLVFPLLSATGIAQGMGVVLNAVAAAPWIFLFLAMSGGIGRGRERRDLRPTRMRLFVLHPTD
jgi:hypothetical protein